MHRETLVRCRECSTLLAEPANLPVEQRVPCPNCGSLGRKKEISVTGSIIANASVSGEALRAQKRLEATYTLEWLRLSEGGAWMVRVYDPFRRFTDASIADDAEEALLAVAERLLPDDEPGT